MSEQETKLDGFEIKEFDVTSKGEVSIDPETDEVMEERTCIGMKFPHAWWPSGCNQAGFWGGCTLIAWRYPPGNYRKPDGSILKWGGGHSPFRRTC